MHSPASAERLLSLITSPDRAASIVGDLMEESGLHGKGWFSIHVLILTFALCLKSIRSSPGRSLLLGVLGLNVHSVVIFGAVILLSDLIWSPWYRIGEPKFWVGIVLAIIVINLLTGLVLARWVSVGGMNGIVPIIVIWLADWIAWPFLAQFVWQLPWYWNVGITLTRPILCVLPLLVGATLGYRRPIV